MAQAQGLARLKFSKESKEIDVETYFVPAFLAMLGYRYPRDIQNAPTLDSPEYYVGSQKRRTVEPDHIVLADNRIAFILEAKSPSEKLGKAQIGQLLSYALHPDVQVNLGVITNGLSTIVVHAKRREPILQVDQSDLPARLPDLQLLLGRKSLARQVGELVIEKRVGQGGFGTIYKCWNISLQRYEALKIYHPQVGATAASRRRLVSGLRAQAQLQHECIAQVYQIQTTGAEAIAVMQFSSGITFDRWRKANTSIRQRIRVLSQVARAIHFAHERGVVHRDLKPSNVLIERKGRSWKPLIVDFDTAVVTDATQLTQTSDKIGTLGFMAPEMFPGPSSSRLKKRSPQVDLYSLGALAFYTFFGPPPQRGAAPRPERLIKRLKGLREGQARKLVYTILKAMDLEPGGRHPTALHLANDFEEALSLAPTLDTDTEQQFVDILMLEVNRLLEEKPLSTFKVRRYKKGSQLGRLWKVSGFGDLIVMHDFDHRELMTGYSFPQAQQFNAFSKSPVLPRLRQKLGKSLVVDPPNPWEEGGAYVMWRLSEMRQRRPKALAREVVGILRTFCDCLENCR